MKRCTSAVLALALAAVAPLAFAQSAHVEGTLEAGPTGQGTCTLSGTEAFLCSNGAYCTWEAAASHFDCVGGTGAVEETSTEGPPGRSCTAHLDHWDCEDGSYCELTENVWVCEGGGESAEGSGSTCIVHGGHTVSFITPILNPPDPGSGSSASIHGDCSGQCNGVDLGEYDMDLHIVSLFVVLVSSLFGVLLPLFSSLFMSKTVFSDLFFAAKHFGTGIIISTAFVHLLYHSFIMFGNTCLGELVFEPAAAAISMAGVYTVFSVDFFVMRWLKTRASRRSSADSVASADDAPSPSASVEKQRQSEAIGHSHGPAPNEHTDYASPQAHFDVMILEAGIIFHSIMIGVSLGASGGSQWVPLFCAIVFHQLFEGLALGSRIGMLIWPAGKWWKKWVMAGAFGLITPIGIAIGMGVHSAYNPNSGAALLSIGILDSISAGILIYAGIVEMLYHDFMHGPLAHARWPKVGAAFFFLLAGSLCMSVLGKWA
ncbi:hypothetical protein JCM10207_002868 [Rhodosporidiobolus poonsookiae]